MIDISNNILRWINFKRNCMFCEKLDNEICNNPSNSSGTCCFEDCPENRKQKINKVLVADIEIFSRIKDRINMTSFDTIEDVKDIEEMLCLVLPTVEEMTKTSIKKAEIKFREK